MSVLVYFPLGKPTLVESQSDINTEGILLDIVLRRTINPLG